jgi:hypothetical protein
MMTVIRTDDNAFRDFLFQQLGFLIGIVKQHIRQGFSEHYIHLFSTSDLLNIQIIISG